MRATSTSAASSASKVTGVEDYHTADCLLPDCRAERLVARRYRLETRLDANQSRHGGAGQTWRAQHVQGDLPVLIKLLDPAIAEDPALLQSFFWEVHAAAAVSSEHVTRIVDCGVESRTPFVVMELLEGQTLETRLQSGALSASDLERAFRHACLALDEVHALGHVHRDLRPSRLFLARSTGRDTTKLLFGISKIMNDTLDLIRKLASRAVAPPGTVHYMSPEQVLGRSTLDYRSDLWSLAVIAYECITGKLPFRGDNLGDCLVAICTAPPVIASAVCPVPAGFDAWFDRGVKKVPSQRFGSALEMSDCLSRILTA